eukprot:4630823-Amphidinium_carterae.2
MELFDTCQFDKLESRSPLQPPALRQERATGNRVLRADTSRLPQQSAGGAEVLQQMHVDARIADFMAAPAAVPRQRFDVVTWLRLGPVCCARASAATATGGERHELETAAGADIVQGTSLLRAVRSNAEGLRSLVLHRPVHEGRVWRPGCTLENKAGLPSTTTPDPSHRLHGNESNDLKLVQKRSGVWAAICELVAALNCLTALFEKHGFANQVHEWSEKYFSTRSAKCPIFLGFYESLCEDFNELVAARGTAAHVHHMFEKASEGPVFTLSFRN